MTFQFMGSLEATTTTTALIRSFFCVRSPMHPELLIPIINQLPTHRSIVVFPIASPFLDRFHKGKIRIWILAFSFGLVRLALFTLFLESFEFFSLCFHALLVLPIQTFPLFEPSWVRAVVFRLVLDWGKRGGRVAVTAVVVIVIVHVYRQVRDRCRNVDWSLRRSL